MPRIKQELQLTAFYLYGRSPKTGQIEGPRGTGVFVMREPANPLFRPHVYAVTAHHVAVEHGASILRINQILGSPVSFGATTQLSSRFLEHEPHEWLFMPGSDDLAAIDVSDEIWPAPNFKKFDFLRGVDERDFVTENFVMDVVLGAGDDGLMLGLFAKNPGRDFNLPAARFGNISQIANPKNPVPQGNGVVRPSHIFDMHSRPGFSGSPVYVYRTPDNDLTAIDSEGNFHLDMNRRDNAFLKFLGIHSGQFEENLEVSKAEAYGQLPIHEGDHITVPSSMTVIVPAWRITELLNLPQFEELRVMRETRLTKEGPARVRPEIALVVPGGQNPDH